MEAIYYTLRAVNGDYAELVTDGGEVLSITMFLLPEGADIGSRLKLNNAGECEIMITGKKALYSKTIRISAKLRRSSCWH